MRAYAWLASCALLAPAACAPGPPETVPLRLVESRPVEVAEAEWVYELSFEDSRGESVRAYLRGPTGAESAQAALYGIVLVAGRETGREAAAMVPGPLHGLVLGVEYLEGIPEALEPGALLRQLFRVRREALRMPGVLLGATDFLAELPPVDTARLALVGVSFGVPFAAAAGRGPRFAGVALLYGGADLGYLFGLHLPIGNRPLRSTAARLLAWFFRGLDPARHVGDISPTPLLLINGTEDTWVPPRSARRLAAAARPPLRHIWLPHGHLMPQPDFFPLMRELADSTVRHFPFLDGRGDTISDPEPVARHVP